MYKFCKLLLLFWTILILAGIYEQLKDLNKTLKDTTKSVEVIDVSLEEIISTPETPETPETPDLEILFYAIATVESQNTPTAVGDNGKARGIIQMHKISVEEINQKCFGYDKYTWDDSWCPNKSKEMFMIYAKYLINNRVHKYPDLTAEEVIARTWNGGYNFKIKPKTKTYWNKVDREIKNLS